MTKNSKLSAPAASPANQSEGVEQTLQSIREVLFSALEMEEESLAKCDRSAFELATIASNGIFWRNKEIARLRGELGKLAASPELRELVCQKCGRDYPIWSAPNELWNKVVRDGEHFLCMDCFALAAESRGVSSETWMLSEGNLELSKVLEENRRLKLGLPLGHVTDQFALPSTPEETGLPNAGKFPITLNAAQEEAVKGWALSYNLFADTHVAEFNLRTFARVIISRGAAPSSVTPPQDELEHMKSQRDYLQRVCSKIQMIVGQSDLPDRSSELDVLPSSVAILAARASSPSSATEPPTNDWKFFGNKIRQFRKAIINGGTDSHAADRIVQILHDTICTPASSAGTPEGK